MGSIAVHKHSSGGSDWLAKSSQVLIAKCLARRQCRDCGKNYNLADIDLPASDGKPAICMPPLLPPTACAAKLETRSDDNFATVKRRIEVCYVCPLEWAQASQVWLGSILCSPASSALTGLS